METMLITACPPPPALDARDAPPVVSYWIMAHHKKRLEIASKGPGKRGDTPHGTTRTGEEAVSWGIGVTLHIRATPNTRLNYSSIMVVGWIRIVQLILLGAEI